MITEPMNALDGPSAVARLDALAGQLAKTVFGLDVEDLEPALARALRRLGEALDADTCTFLESAADGSILETVGTWVAPHLPRDLAPLKLSGMNWFTDRLVRGDVIRLDRIPDDLPPDAIAGFGAEAWRLPIKSATAVPVTVSRNRTCALLLTRLRHGPAWGGEIIDRVQLIAGILGAAADRRRHERLLRAREAELAYLATELKSQATVLRDEIEMVHGFQEIVGNSPALAEMLARVNQVASTDATVMLVGETGTGKELLARAVHDHSQRRQRPLLRVNCAALPPTLIESELFGHERGAFTGAVSARQGRFELADRSTIFLDEIGDLPRDLQAKLLRVLQEGEFERVGSSHTRKVDVRVIAATNRDLITAIEQGEFRADLYYRLSVFPIHVPPLRERLQDIPQLVWFFVHKRQRALHRYITTIPDAAMEALQRYSWPGNVRELGNVIERALIRSTDGTLVIDSSLDESLMAPPTLGGDTLDAFERRHIEGVLRRCGWRINGSGNAAERLKIHPNTLRFRMKKLGIKRPLPAYWPDRSVMKSRRAAGIVS